jgi:tRNA(fMet)-specific endonuclease VapC
MIRFLLDTGVCNDYSLKKNGIFEWAQSRRIAGDRIGIVLPVLTELFFGVYFSKLEAGKARNIERIRNLKNQLLIWPFDGTAAEQCGILLADLRANGRLMSTNDVMIAAVAKTMNCTVVTYDSDFLAIADLSVERWTKTTIQNESP